MKKAVCAILIWVSSIVMSASAQAEGKGYIFPGFKSAFHLSPNSQRGGFAFVKDPVDANNEKKVLRFTVKPARCVGDDCSSQSVRSSINQYPSAVQPSEGWYGWEMLFPSDFPAGYDQSTGFQQFNEFKDQLQCGLASLAINLMSRDSYLIWRMHRPTGQKYSSQKGEDCKPTYEKYVVSLSEIRGSWHRFELYAKWTRKSDGAFELYIDGKRVVDYKGPTCFADCSKMNYYAIGNYICCTPNTKKISTATVYYRYISRAKSRDKLLWQ